MALYILQQKPPDYRFQEKQTHVLVTPDYKYTLTTDNYWNYFESLWDLLGMNTLFNGIEFDNIDLSDKFSSDVGNLITFEQEIVIRLRHYLDTIGVDLTNEDCPSNYISFLTNVLGFEFNKFNNEKVIYSYNTQDQLGQILHYNYINNRLVEKRRQIDLYDDHGNIIQVVLFEDKCFYLNIILKYNNDNCITEDITQTWNTLEEAWENHSRYLYSYKTIQISVSESGERYGQAYCYPNPVISQTKINFKTMNPDNIKIAIYDYLGNETMKIQKGQMQEGRHEIVFDASALPSGVYYCRILGGGANETVKMTVVE